MKNTSSIQKIILVHLLVLISYLSCFEVFAQKIEPKKLTAREIAQLTLPSTVLLMMNNSDSEDGKSGSGFFVAEDVVVTNFHVIKETTEGFAKIYGQEKIYQILGVVGVDEANDLALLKIDGVKGKQLKLNTDDATAVGDEVFAVGNPKGLEGTFSQGIVSSIRKTEKFNFLQITASISSGSSGGAVLNDNGQVIGVAVGAIESGQSLNFAIPVSLLRDLISKKTLLKPLASIQVKSKSEKSAKSDNRQLPKTEFPKRNPVEVKTSELQKNTLNWTSLKMFGRVSSIKTDYYLVSEKFGKLVLGNPVATSTERFNLDGYRIFDEDTVFTKEGLEETYSKSDFDKFGNKEFPFTSRKEYSYDYKNNQKTYKNSVKCADCSTYIFAFGFITNYNANEEITFLSNGELLGKKITEQSGNEKTEYDYDNEGKLSGKYIETNTSMGRELKMYFATFESLLNNSKDREVYLHSHRIFQEEEIQGNIKFTTIDLKNGKEVKRSISVRNKDTNLEIYSEKDGKILEYSYEFDKQGNWITQSEFEQVSKFGKTYFEQSKVRRRTIVYY